MAIHDELTDATRIWLDKANQVFGKTFPRPLISLRLKGGTAGYAIYDKWMVKYNPELYVRNKQEFIDRTVPHELAHLITSNIYGRVRVKHHGWQWRLVMQKLGVVDVKRCHSYDVTGIKNVRARPYVYQCQCGTEYRLTKTLHNKILKGRYRVCPKCRTRIVLQYIEATKVEA